MTFEVLKKNIEALTEEIPKFSSQIESERRIPTALHSLLKETGVFQMTVPKDRGGLELTSMEQIEIIEKLSEANGSVGWSVMIGCDSGIYGAYIGDEAASQVYSKPNMSTAGWIAPGGFMTPTEGGYTVSGKWRFGSGCMNADVFAGGCVLTDSEGSPKTGEHGQIIWNMALLPADKVKILESTWNTEGLKGTGSHDYEAEDVFVPKEYTFDFFGPSKRKEPLYRKNDVFLRKMPGIPLGIAKAAFEDASRKLKRRRDIKLNKNMADSDWVKISLSEAETLIRSSRAYLMNALESQHKRFVNNEELSEQERKDLILSRTNVFHSCREAVRKIYDLMGGTAIYNDRSNMNRYINDLNTACQHFVAQKEMFNQMGDVTLGNSPHSNTVW